jgi:hypothetical protein
MFFVVTLIVAGVYMIRSKRKARAGENTKSAVHSALADPMLIATGIQIVRAIGVKRLVPILAVGGLALGILASRGNSAQDEAPEA